MSHDVNKGSHASDSAYACPIYEPPVLIDCGTVAALTLGSGTTAGSDAFGAAGAGGGDPHS
jgi:hypothetical protein